MIRFKWPNQHFRSNAFQSFFQHLSAKNKLERVGNGWKLKLGWQFDFKKIRFMPPTAFKEKTFKKENIKDCEDTPLGGL